MTDENIRAVEEVVMRDRQISVRRIADELGISQIPLYEIISDYLGVKKACTRRVPELLTLLQRANRVDCCEEPLENCSRDPTGFIGHIMIEDEDEIWIHLYDPLSQQEAKTWKKPGEKTSTRPRVT